MFMTLTQFFDEIMILILFSISVFFSLFNPDLACRGYPIGMENGKIPDDNIVASSWQEPFHSFRPEAGRLNNDDGVWCPNTLGEADKEYFLQVEFPARYNICAVATQGSPLYNTDWVKKYRIQHSMDGENFTLYTENGTVKVWCDRASQAHVLRTFHNTEVERCGDRGRAGKIAVKED